MKKNTRIVVYTHDTYGLGNIRRMLAVAEHLNSTIENVSLLIISGSPMLHSFRLEDGIDYVKLPTITRSTQGDYQSRTPGLSLKDTIKMRSGLILTTIRDFRPDIILVDKKPLGLHKELTPVLHYLQQKKTKTRLFLILRDILDAADVTHTYWKNKGYFKAIDRYYEKVLILGSQSVFNASQAYRFPQSVKDKTHYCGYLMRNISNLKIPQWVRKELGLQQEKIILVTPGGGADGEHILTHFLEFWQSHDLGEKVHAVVVYGPELSGETKNKLTEYSKSCQQLSLFEFTPHLLSYMQASDVVVSMGGYNTLCETLSLNKKVVCIPRTLPVEEQLMRARCFSALGLLAFINPDELSAHQLSIAISRLVKDGDQITSANKLTFSALEEVRKHLVHETNIVYLSVKKKPVRPCMSDNRVLAFRSTFKELANHISISL